MLAPSDLAVGVFGVQETSCGPGHNFKSSTYYRFICISLDSNRKTGGLSNDLVGSNLWGIQFMLRGGG